VHPLHTSPLFRCELVRARAMQTYQTAVAFILPAFLFLLSPFLSSFPFRSYFFSFIMLRLAGHRTAALRSAADAGIRTFATNAADGAMQPRKKFDPTKIYPSKAGHVRICNNTTRDAQQSNLSAEMAAIHRIQIAKLIDDCYKDMKGPTGVEQIWGGTIPMFDIWSGTNNCTPFCGLPENLMAENHR
jgi:hypothetical protein